jgi:molecular chaperone DnaK
MVRDAEAHAAEDKKFEELVQVRNQADGMIHATRKTLVDVADKVEPAEKAAIEKAIAELEEALKEDDKDAIESKTQALAEASGSLAQKLYADQGQQADGAQAQDAAAGPDDAVDAEFEEVKDDKK